MRLVFVLASIVILGLGVVMTIAIGPVDAPMIAATRVTPDAVSGARLFAVDRSATPDASIGFFVDQPTIVVVRGHVVPGHNTGMQLSVDLICFSRGGAASEYHGEFPDWSPTGPDQALAMQVDIRITGASLCHGGVSSGPASYSAVRKPKPSSARISLHCPEGCTLRRG